MLAIPYSVTACATTDSNMSRPTSRRAGLRLRRFSAVELAVAFALVGSLLAVAVPSFVREVHASRMAEPVDGLQRIGAAAIIYAKARPVGVGFPASAPLTPPTPPPGHCAVDPTGLWEQPTWKALDFRPTPEGVPHCFAFSFDSALSPAKSTFRADAHGDLDGDGIRSTFELAGHYVEGDPAGPTIDPGLYVESEME
jgi:hypothetical protein